MPSDISKPALAGAALVGVLAIGVIAQAVFGGEPENEAAPDLPASSQTVTLAPAPTPAAPTDPAVDPGAEPEAAIDPAAALVASDAVVAYTQHSWADPNQNSWIERTSAYATDGLAHELAETFGAEDPYWSREVVPNQRETRTTIVSAEPSGMHAETNTSDEVTFTVTYETSVKTKDMAEWGEADPMSLWVTAVRQGEAWKVSHIGPTGEGGF